MEYRGLCVSSLTISFLMVVGIFLHQFNIISKLEICFLSYCLGLGHATMVYALYIYMYCYVLKIKYSRLRRVQWRWNSDLTVYSNVALPKWKGDIKRALVPIPSQQTPIHIDANVGKFGSNFMHNYSSVSKWINNIVLLTRLTIVGPHLLTWFNFNPSMDK